MTVLRIAGIMADGVEIPLNADPDAAEAPVPASATDTPPPADAAEPAMA